MSLQELSGWESLFLAVVCNLMHRGLPPVYGWTWVAANGFFLWLAAWRAGEAVLGWLL